MFGSTIRMQLQIHNFLGIKYIVKKIVWSGILRWIIIFGKMLTNTLGTLINNRFKKVSIRKKN